MENPDVDLFDELKRIERIRGHRLGDIREQELTVDKVRNNLKKYFQHLAKENKFATITGMALHMGFRGRKDMINYEALPEYEEIIKIGKSIIEYSYEIRLKMPDVKQTGILFALKQMGWEDKQTIETSNTTDAEVAKMLDKVPEKKLKAIQKMLK